MIEDLQLNVTPIHPSQGRSLLLALISSSLSVIEQLEHFQSSGYLQQGTERVRVVAL